uniref:R3H domain-containing protein n=1 Tax=Meloidogyne floridensis TaxID=298350 RepID=A0A915NCE5_9BILA
MAEQRQDTLNKRKVFTRSDAVVGDDENKEELSIKQAESPKKQLFRDLSYADSMGIDVLRFVENTLHKNAKDREFLLFIEEETRKFLIHRVAAFFGLIHNVDQSGQQVVITKQKGHTRIPDIKFSSLIKHSNFEDKFHFGRRNVQSFDESNISTLCNHRSTTNFGGPPPSSFRPFRNRFYTSGGSQFNNNNNKSRRTRSFEISDWTNSSSTTLFNQQQQQQFTAWLQPSNLEIVTAGGEGMSTSNCSSSASSGAVIHHQMTVGGNGSGGGGIPFQIYPTGQIVLTNE